MYRLLVLSLILSLCLVSCFDSENFESIHNDSVFEQSSLDRPIWIYRSFYESQNQFYFVRYIRSEFNSPSLAYNLVRRDLHAFFEREAAYLLQPILANVSKNQYTKLHREFKLFLSKQLMATVRNQREIYWEKVSFQKNDTANIGYWYYVLLPVSKKSLRLLEQTFILKKLEFARKNRKKLLIKELEASLGLINEIRSNDKNRHSKLPKDYVLNLNSN